MSKIIKELIETLGEKHFEIEQEIFTIISKDYSKILTVDEIEPIDKLRKELNDISKAINMLLNLEKEENKKGEFVETPQGGEFYKTKNNTYHLLLGVNVKNNNVSSDIIFIMKESKEHVGFLEHINYNYGYDKEVIEKLILKHEMEIENNGK